MQLQAQQMKSEIISFQELQEISGFQRLSDVTRWARDNSLPVKGCRGGVWTTITALNMALGITTAQQDSTTYPPNVI